MQSVNSVQFLNITCLLPVSAGTVASLDSCPTTVRAPIHKYVSITIVTRRLDFKIAVLNLVFFVLYVTRL